MDLLNRLLGTNIITPRKPPKPANDPATRLSRFKRVYHGLLELCDRPRNPATEGRLLGELNAALDRLTTLLRDETRAPVPHVCFRFAASRQIYAAIARAAAVSRHEPVIRSAIAVFVSLVDSEEEEFLASEHFAKCLMRLVRKVVESGVILVNTETETCILELLFTIAAKIRLQPEILPIWFQHTAPPERADVFVGEQQSFVGLTHKDDFPLCYIFIERVHHEGRIGDFARTGLLYIFEATGRSSDLEEWVISSDLSTLMASGLGALYSQLSRELSILHADAELPAVLAMSDYSTTHPRATAESAFSPRHTSHMATFLSYLAFWQDVLDHCRSAHVKQTLLDHFQVLFLQQLLYPSLLQSSDTDAGSSVAVLTYMNAILDALEYPELLDMILVYLLAIERDRASAPSAPHIAANAAAAPRSPTTIRRRHSLMLLSKPKDPSDVVEPTLFNLVDLITNNVESSNTQSVVAALRLASTLITRQRRYAFGTVLKVDKVPPHTSQRTVGALETEIEQYAELAESLHPDYNVDIALARVSEDTRYMIESQVPALPAEQTAARGDTASQVCIFQLLDHDPLLRTMRALLRTFFTNSIDVNLGLTHAIISTAQCVEICLDGWVAMSPAKYSFAEQASAPAKTWQAHLERDDEERWIALRHVLRRPIVSTEAAPILQTELRALAEELELVRAKVPNFDQLIAGRKVMLQATPVDMASLGDASTIAGAADRRRPRPDVPRPSPRRHSTSASPSSLARHVADHANPKTHHAGTSTPPSPPAPPETPSTTDVLMQLLTFPHRPAGDGAHVNNSSRGAGEDEGGDEARTTSLNHVLTNVVVLQEFVLELMAVIQIRAAVLGEKEVRHV